MFGCGPFSGSSLEAWMCLSHLSRTEIPNPVSLPPSEASFPHTEPAGPIRSAEAFPMEPQPQQRSRCS